MARSLNDKIKSNLAKKKQIRIAFNASGELQETINRYREFYKQTNEQEITDDVLITTVLESAFRSEKEFQKWLRRTGGKNNQINGNQDNGNRTVGDVNLDAPPNLLTIETAAPNLLADYQENEPDSFATDDAPDFDDLFNPRS